MNVFTLKETPTQLRRGTLYAEKQAIYIIEILDDGNVPLYATVYEVQPNSKPPMKAYQQVGQTFSFKTSTALGRLASKHVKVAPSKKNVELPPLFMAEIVNGTDTFTGKHGTGFWERERDRTQLLKDGVEVIHGDRTGVFIELSSITWEKLIIPTEEVIREVQANKILFFGFGAE